MLMSEILDATQMGARGPTRVHIALADPEIEKLSFGAPVRIEVGNSSFGGTLVGRGSICSDIGGRSELVVDFHDITNLESFMETWDIVGSGRVFCE